jgi:hypothetical protein
MTTSTTYLVECFWPDVRPEQVNAGAVRARASAATLSYEGRPVSFEGTILVPCDEVVFYLFEGVSADAVGEACLRAELPFARILESIRSND